MKNFPLSPMEPSRLIDQLMNKISSNNNFIGLSIWTAVSQKVPYRQILATVKNEFSSNPDAGIILCGEELFNNIMAFK